MDNNLFYHSFPGCGKTLIAKATAKEAQMSFINLDVSLLTDKWYGETQKLAAAVFSLAVKLQPCIVFIGEFFGLITLTGTSKRPSTPKSLVSACFNSPRGETRQKCFRTSHATGAGHCIYLVNIFTTYKTCGYNTFVID